MVYREVYEYTLPAAICAIASNVQLPRRKTTAAPATEVLFANHGVKPALGAALHPPAVALEATSTTRK